MQKKIWYWIQGILLYMEFPVNLSWVNKIYKRKCQNQQKPSQIQYTDN